ncbi:MAG TPA: DegV family protein [Actinomycetota bacterium]
MAAVVTDSASNLPPELADEAGIQVVPLYLAFGDEVLRDGVDIRPDEFYRRLASDGSATSSTPSPGDFLEAFRATGDREIVCVTVAASMSAAHQQALAAAERFDGTVRVVDSGSASMAQGFVALSAARTLAAGGSPEAAEARARETAERVRLIATVDTFDYLRRSGRVSSLQAYAATVLDIKPVFAFRRGEPFALARPRTRRRAVDRVVEAALADIGGRPVHLATMHAAAPAEARALADRIAAATDVVEQVVVEVTPVIGAHTGPGLLGAAFFCDRATG